MRRGLPSIVCRIFLAAVLSLTAALAQHAEVSAETDRLLNQIANSTQLERDLQTLCGDIGGRMPGTPGMARAVDWAVESFRRAGVDQVRTEEFTIPNSWTEGATKIEVLAPVRFPVRGVSSAWVPATPPGGVRAELIDGGSGSPGRILRLGERARGKILLIRSQVAETFEQLANEQRDSTVALREAARVGAASTSCRPRSWFATMPSEFAGT